MLLFSVVPHITDCIQEWVERVALVPVDGDNKEPDCCIIEVLSENACFDCYNLI